MTDTPRPITESARQKAIDDLSMAWPDGAVAILGWGRKQAEDAVNWVLHSIGYDALVAEAEESEARLELLERHRAFVAAFTAWVPKLGIRFEPVFNSPLWERMMTALAAIEEGT